MNIRLLTHTSIKVEENKVLYFDPFNIKESSKDADIIFVTHDHYDHFSINDIEKVRNDKTIFVAPLSLKNKIPSNNVYYVKPYDKLTIDGVEIEVRPAYNINKRFHPKENGWVGYIVKINNETLYVMGDTDNLVENQNVKVDYLLIPIGGTYTMDVNSASEFTNIVKPKTVIPSHYGSVVGKEEGALAFEKLINPQIKVSIIKEY